MISSIEVDSSSKGSVAIPSKLLIDTLKTFPEQPLTFTVEDNNTVEISSNHGKYALAYTEGDQFPKTITLDNPSSTKISSVVLAKAINSTIFASGNDDLRPVMSGVFFQLSSDNLTFVATDAHKLVKYKRNDIKATTLAEFIMPKKPLNLLKNIIDSDHEVTIEYINSNAKFDMDGLIGCSSTSSDNSIIISSKKLVRIINILGVNSIETNYSPLFYIYDDGTVEKKIIID